jgi:hypothetical protein
MRNEGFYGYRKENDTATTEITVHNNNDNDGGATETDETGRKKAFGIWWSNLPRY